MSKVLVNESNLMAIGAAIRSRNGASTTYRPGEMAAAIQAVPNRYGASDEGKVVSSGALVAQTSTTKTANGTYDTTTNNEVVVNVAPNLQSKTATQNGTVTPDQGYDGLSSVLVNVSGSGSSLIVQPIKYLTNSNYYCAAGYERYYSEAVETVAAFELEIGAHYILSLNGNPGPRFRRVMLDIEPCTIVPDPIPAPGSMTEVIVQAGVDVGGSAATENPAAYSLVDFIATKRYLSVHLSLTPGDTPTVYLFKIL